MIRDLVLLAIVALAPTSVYATEKSDFVYVEGTRFMLNGSPFYFHGTNLYAAGILDDKSTKDVEITLKVLGDKGLKVVRIWGFSNGSWPGVKKAIQPRVGVFDEKALRRLDFAIAKAHTNGMRVILPLVNFLDDYNGMQWYVDSILGPGHEKESFYTDVHVKEAYQNYVAMILNRKNTVTGRVYREEPAILAWELANEPHTTANYERDRGLVPGMLVYNWLREMAAFVKSIDSVHLVAAGEEGYRADRASRPTNCGWLNDGAKGVDFVRNVTIPDIDFATIHVYPDSWNMKDVFWVLDNYVSDRAKAAHAIGKPIILEEYGLRGTTGSREEYFRWIHDKINSDGFAGALVWRILPEVDDDSGYDFGFSDDGAQEVFAQVARLRRLPTAQVDGALRSKVRPAACPEPAVKPSTWGPLAPRQ